MDYDEILDYKYHFEDAEAWSIREYFKNLLLMLWTEGEGFSGKRPFGNSGWEQDLIPPLVLMGVVEGRFEDSGDDSHYLEEYDDIKSDEILLNLIHHCFRQTKID